MFFAIRDLIMKNKISNEDKIIAVHSGGIQGNEAMEKRYRIQK
jgi:1-aminocyclopropane-1-carboxylate deaminase/D-cysteine desulfhydrase-like pyridoxal-dependent ACC family enzyme